VIKLSIVINYLYHLTDDIWLQRNYKLVANRRGGQNLLYNGHMYTVERKYLTTINWVCTKNSNARLRCPARCVTGGNRSIKLSRRIHNHPANQYKVHKPRKRQHPRQSHSCPEL